VIAVFHVFLKTQDNLRKLKYKISIRNAFIFVFSEYKYEKKNKN